MPIRIYRLSIAYRIKSPDLVCAQIPIRGRQVLLQLRFRPRADHQTRHSGSLYNQFKETCAMDLPVSCEISSSTSTVLYNNSLEITDDGTGLPPCATRLPSGTGRLRLNFPVSNPAANGLQTSAPTF